MFNNIGEKIKKLAEIISIIGISISVLAGFIMIIFGAFADEGAIIGIGSGFVIMIVGSLLSWIGSFFTFGFGELIENTTVIAELMAKADAEKNHAE